MSTPTSQSVYEDELLTSFSVAYVQDQANFVYSKAAPLVPVQKQTGKFRKYDKNEWFRDEFAQLGPGAESFGSGYKLSTGSYDCTVWALHINVDDQTRANYAEPGDAEQDAVANLTQKGMIHYERNWVTKFFATSKWDTDATFAADKKWGAFATSDPESDVDTGKNTILGKTGMMPNTLVVGWEVHQKLKRHPLVKEQYKFTSSESISADMLARFFDVENYLVSKAVYASNEEGATAAYAFAAGKNALLCYVDPAPSHMRPSAMKTFVWEGLTRLNDLGMVTLNIPAPLQHSDRIEVQMAYDMNLVASDLGYFLSAVVA